MNKKLMFLQWGLVLLAALSMVWLLAGMVKLLQFQSVNSFIADPTVTEQTPDYPQAWYARAIAEATAGDINAAREAYTTSMLNAEPAMLASSYFNRGNLNFREAIGSISDHGGHISLVELAKQDYRMALRLNPDLWDARHNLELALRLVPEDPTLDGFFEKDFISEQLSIESKAFKVELP
ncbi:MxaK protein [Methylophaga lonarensis]|uniref:MxaK protein n=1 Tax=Methylophaga lonarensis TaxID=999151 RepID=UPI003D26761D